MHKAPIVGRVGACRVNSVNEQKDACNVRIVRNSSFVSRDTNERVEKDHWVTVSFFKDKGGFDRMKDTTFRVGNTISVEVSIQERKRDDRTELMLVGRGGVDVLAWGKQEEAQAGGQGGQQRADQHQGGQHQGGQGQGQGQGQGGQNQGGGFAGPGDDFDDDIPF